MAVVVCPDAPLPSKHSQKKKNLTPCASECLSVPLFFFGNFHITTTLSITQLVCSCSVIKFGSSMLSVFQMFTVTTCPTDPLPVESLSQISSVMRWVDEGVQEHQLQWVICIVMCGPV